jgi:hypothetical protein
MTAPYYSIMSTKDEGGRGVPFQARGPLHTELLPTFIQGSTFILFNSLYIFGNNEKLL